MRFSTISAVLCGLAIVPGVVSQSSSLPSPPQASLGDDSRLADGVGTNTKSLSSISTLETPFSGDFGTGITGIGQPSDSHSSHSEAPRIAGGSKVSQIAGGVVGGVLGLALIGGLIFFLKRRKRNREKPSAHHESAVIADKSRASSPVSHTSPIYGGAGAAVVPPPAAPARQFTDPELANPPPSQQPVVPIAPVHTPQQQQAAYSPGSPAELQSREVDVDGVSVNSFDMQRPVDEPAIPRLPVSRPTGSGL